MAAENSFDIACKLDMQEVANAINQSQREIGRASCRERVYDDV